MKKSILNMLLIIGLVVWLLNMMPFSTHINQTVKANVYKDGQLIEATAIEMSGSKSNYLFKDKQYYTGSFCIQYYERTCREDVKAAIDWYKNGDNQIIVYSQNATFLSLELLPGICINESMNEFAFKFKDGTVVALQSNIC